MSHSGKNSLSAEKQFRENRKIKMETSLLDNSDTVGVPKVK
jgi:hypothetical protein